jgi:RsiW-degrading membrane proteinase PrsW (M82 family)
MAALDLATLGALAFAPGIFWLWYFYKRDTCEPEPRRLILSAFLLGMAITLPVAVVEALVGDFVGSIFVLAVVVAPIVEEIGKFLAVWWAIFPSAEFDQVIDGVTYSVAAALGFASVENVLYVFSSSMDGPFAVIGTYSFRAFFSVPAHALISSIWGFALGRAKFADASRRNSIIGIGLVSSMLAHAAFNFFAGIGALIGLFILIVGVVPILWLVANRNIGEALRACIPRFSPRRDK